MTSTNTIAVSNGLRAGFGGILIEPGDIGYDDARRLHNGMIDKRPALIAQCRSTADVIDAVNFGRDASVEVTRGVLRLGLGAAQKLVSRATRRAKEMPLVAQRRHGAGPIGQPQQHDQSDDDSHGNRFGRSAGGTERRRRSRHPATIAAH